MNCGTLGLAVALVIGGLLAVHDDYSAGWVAVLAGALVLAVASYSSRTKNA